MAQPQYVLYAWSNDPTGPAGKRQCELARLSLKATNLGNPTANVYDQGYNDGVFAALSKLGPGLDVLEMCVDASQAALCQGKITAPITIGHRLTVE